MKKVLPIKIKYIYKLDSDNDERLRKVYFRLFDLAKASLFQKKKVKEQVLSTS